MSASAVYVLDVKGKVSKSSW